ncbi:MAG: hypothetical protein KatS3mg023_1632 [Armatimonadota bacterium]|nr:MAG: hypothetical protein KatS3mg023_1632 [Armatimonadota bacterium]
MQTVRKGLNSVCACNWVFILAFLLRTCPVVWAQPLTPPVDKAQVTQAFAAYNVGKMGKYHTGIDVSPISSDYAERRAQTVKAVQNGKVAHIFGLRLPDGKWYVRWWDGNPKAYRWVSGAQYVRASSNRGLGICVILEHEGSPRVYTLYGHLDAVRANLKIGDMVQQGDEIGLVGNSGQDSQGRDYLRFCPAKRHAHSSKCLQDVDRQNMVTEREGGFSPHLHFEVKYQSVLGDYSNQPGTGEVGYTSYDPFYPHPDRQARYYVDPLLWLYASRTFSSSYVQIIEPVNARIGPGNYPQSTSLASGHKFKALASAISAWPADNTLWYLVEAVDGSLFPHPGEGKVPRVWVCEGADGEKWVQLLSIPNIRLSVSADKTNLLPEGVVTVNVQALNTGDTDAVDVKIICPLPSMSSYVPGSLRVNGVSYPDPVAAGGKFEVLVPLLPKGQQVLIQYRVIIKK